MVFYNLTKDEEFEGASIILADGTALPVSSDHPRYEQIVLALVKGEDEESVVKLVNPAQAAYGALTRLTERVTRKGNTLFFDGDALSNALTKHIVRIMDEEVESGTDETPAWQAYVNFLEKLATNPSEASKEHLFHFIEAHGITITESGDVILYKGVDIDGLSIHSGYGIVDGVVYENAKLPNKVGSVIEIPRSMVDDNRNAACSTGLHGGTHQYANDFGRGGKLLTIAVNPRDVVSVPSDHSDAKVRVARYTVLEENTAREAYTSTWVATFSGFAADEDYGDEYGYEYAFEEDEPEDDDLDLDYEEPEDEDEDEPAEVEGAFVGADGLPVLFEEGSRVPEYIKLIQNTLLPNDVKLRRFRGRNVTAGRRDEFTQAAALLGIDLDEE